MAAKLRRIGGEGPAVLLIHGFGADRMGWVANTPALMEQHSVWAVDLPAHGEAEPGAITFEDLTDSVVEATKGLDGPLALVGHSLGGAIASQMVARDPVRYGATLLLAPAGFGAGSLNAAFLQGFATLESEDEALGLLRLLVERERLIQPPMAQYVLAHLARPGRRQALAAMAAAALSLIPPALPEKALVIWGENDQINRPDLSWLESLGERAVLLTGTGHLPHLEAATRVNRLMLEHLAKA